MPDLKPQRRVVDPNAGREKVAREGRCRVTGKTRWVTRFHLVGRDLGGDDVDDNLVPIDQYLHMAWEHEPGGKQKHGPAIWQSLTDAEREYVLGKKGARFVERYYGVVV